VEGGVRREFLLGENFHLTSQSPAAPPTPVGLLTPRRKVRLGPVSLFADAPTSGLKSQKNHACTTVSGEVSSSFGD